MPVESTLYEEAGLLYCKVAAGRCNLKNGLFQSNFTTDLKKLLAIVAEAIKNKALINEIFKRAIRGRIEVKPSAGGLECDDGGGCLNCKTKVMIYDMMLGRAGSNTAGCPLVSKLRFYRNILDELAKELKLATTEAVIAHFRPATDGADAAARLPVYVRVNTLLTDWDTVIAHFQRQGFNFLPYDDKSVKYNQFLEWAKALGERDFMPDYHLHGSVLVFHPAVQLHSDRLVRSRHALIQDKASCIPAAVLAPCGTLDVLDACAAPGNKTTQLLALMEEARQQRRVANGDDCVDGETPEATLFAFDRNEARFRSLETALAPYISPSNGLTGSGVRVSASLEDFMRVDPHASEYARVGYICLDPSCSGSGIMRQIDRVAERADGSRVDPARLASLRNVQAMLLGHALQFPGARRVVYSTCSVTVDENEAVVNELLEQHRGEWALQPVWPDWWLTRGKKALKACLRTSPSYDLCNGFFVACFERVGPPPPPGSSLAHRTSRVVRDNHAASGENEETETGAAGAGGKHWRKRRKTKKTGRKARENEARRLLRGDVSAGAGHHGNEKQADHGTNESKAKSEKTTNETPANEKTTGPIKSANQIDEVKVDDQKKKKSKKPKTEIVAEQSETRADPVQPVPNQNEGVKKTKKKKFKVITEQVIERVELDKAQKKSKKRAKSSQDTEEETPARRARAE